jgi:hypothetical protein
MPSSAGDLRATVNNGVTNEAQTKRNLYLHVYEEYRK